MAKKAGLPQPKVDEPSSEVTLGVDPSGGQHLTEIPDGQARAINPPKTAGDKNLPANGA